MGGEAKWSAELARGIVGGGVAVGSGSGGGEDKWLAESSSPGLPPGGVEDGTLSSSGGKFEQVPLRFGRQFVQGCLAFTHAQFRHRPLPLHRQHEGGIIAVSLQLKRRSMKGRRAACKLYELLNPVLLSIRNGQPASTAACST